MLTDAQQRAAAKKFAAEWNGRGYEKGETHAFWMELLQMVCGVANPAQFITFESQVLLGHTSFIDAYIPETKVMIEQKSLDVDLNKPAKQSDGSMLTPYQQAKRYSDELELSQKPRYIVVCNFQTFHVHDMEHPHDAPEIIQLADLPKEYHRLAFLTDVNKAHLKREMDLSIKAGEIVGQIYDAILKHYNDPSAESTLKSLNMLCVRLVFCLYAEDAGIFVKDQFHDYLARFDARDIRRALIDLFKVLDTPEDKRKSLYLDDDLAAFPYVNGGLFAETDIEIPQFDDTVKELLLAKASDDFNWSEISPTIFGAVFESTLNPETRRSGGMHYTSIENIHKVIDPLFLDDLKAELEEILNVKAVVTRNKKLFAFQDKLAGLTFLDPACGSGNFLTETYLSLRKLENKCLEVINAGQTVLGFDDVIKVSIGQFYGIEINDFAVTVAKTALWIAESQMMKATEDIVHMDLDFLPLKSYANIIEANALRIDWNTVIPKEKLNYIMGNPPFVGARMMDQGSTQKLEVEEIFGAIKDVQDLDYVTCWYKKAAIMIQNSNIKVAFVSTNSVCQGSQVPILWGVLYNDYNVHINFAWQTFKWNSEASEKAAVHCVIVGFSRIESSDCILFSADKKICCKKISPYLCPGEEVFIVAEKNAICDVPKMNFGNQPRDGGNFIVSPEEYDYLLQNEPDLKQFLHPYIGAEEFIKGKKRYCFWLRNTSPAIIAKSKTLRERVEAVREFRLASKAKTTNQYAKVPACFAQITQPEGKDYIIIPRVSSERRFYIPMGFMPPDTTSSDAVQILPDATLFHFGVLTSLVHMAWMRTVAGRLKSDCRYSKEIVYNTFPWCEPTEAQKAAIEKTAQVILDARALYPDCSLADLYDEATMPPELRKAHQANDKAVMKAYGYESSMSEPEIVADLMKRYQELTAKEK